MLHGFDVDIVSIKGGLPPLDENSTQAKAYTEACDAFERDVVVEDKLKNTRSRSIDTMVNTAQEY